MIAFSNMVKLLPPDHDIKNIPTIANNVPKIAVIVNFSFNNILPNNNAKTEAEAIKTTTTFDAKPY